MKILFTTDQIYLHGGIERVLAIKANYFADVMGYDVSILTTEQKGKQPFFQLSKNINLVDISINYIRTKSYFSFENLKKVPVHFSKLRNILQDLNPDIVINCNFAFDFYWLPFINRTSRKIKEYHASQFRRLDKPTSKKQKLGNQIRDLIEKKYDAIVLLNPDEQGFFKSTNTVVIPNPIELNNQKANVQNKKVIAAGRIAPVKGFDRLIEIWAMIYKNFPDWSLEIYGDDYLATQDELQKRINSLGLNRNIIFKGTVDNMSLVMCNYSVYVMTSHTECFPMVLLESLSVGLPIIAFDVPTGPRNIITDTEDGFLIIDGQIETFSEKLKHLLTFDNERKKMSLVAKENIERFSIENVMDEWNKLFDKVQSP